jgi:hypothetical protein
VLPVVFAGLNPNRSFDRQIRSVQAVAPIAITISPNPAGYFIKFGWVSPSKKLFPEEDTSRAPLPYAPLQVRAISLKIASDGN